MNVPKDRWVLKDVNNKIVTSSRKTENEFFDLLLKKYIEALRTAPRPVGTMTGTVLRNPTTPNQNRGNT